MIVPLLGFRVGCDGDGCGKQYVDPLDPDRWHSTVESAERAATRGGWRQRPVEDLDAPAGGRAARWAWHCPACSRRRAVEDDRRYAVEELLQAADGPDVLPIAAAFEDAPGAA